MKLATYSELKQTSAEMSFTIAVAAAFAAYVVTSLFFLFNPRILHGKRYACHILFRIVVRRNIGFNLPTFFLETANQRQC